MRRLDKNPPGSPKLLIIGPKTSQDVLICFNGLYYVLFIIAGFNECLLCFLFFFFLERKKKKEKLLRAQENVHMYEMAFEQQYHFGIFYAWVKLREQEIRNIRWIANMVVLNTKDHIDDTIVPIFQPRM